MEFVAGIDLGTSYFKVGLFGRDGTMHGLGRVIVQKDMENGLNCELPTVRFWLTLREAFTIACTQAHARPQEIKALSYSSQANSFVLLEENGNLLTPIILWPDQRVQHIDQSVHALWKRQDFIGTTGIGIEYEPGLCIAKLKWFQKHRPDIWAHTRKVMTISDYFIFMLTSKPVSDAGTASLLGLYDLSHHTWWDEAFDTLVLDLSYFSTPLLPGTTIGAITPEGAKFLGIAAGSLLTVGSLDHHMAAIGAGVPIIAIASESTGSVVACLEYLTEFLPKAGCCMGSGLDENTFYQLAFSGNGAGALEWYQKTFAANMTISDLLSQAQSVPAGAQGLIALPSADGYPYLTGFKNVSSKHTHGHYIRAILESNTAYKRRSKSAAGKGGGKVRHF